jgi:hypothetical protein
MEAEEVSGPAAGSREWAARAAVILEGASAAAAVTSAAAEHQGDGDET